MAANDTLLQLLLGGLLGLTGQALRTIVGMKKLNDTAQQQDISVKNLFQTSRFVVSLMLGAAAGILATIPLLPIADTGDKKTLLTMLAAGYAGTDFIEGFVKKYLPGGGSSDTNGQNVKPVKKVADQPQPVV